MVFYAVFVAMAIGCGSARKLRRAPTAISEAQSWILAGV
jgi:hypothetical protein